MRHGWQQLLSRLVEGHSIAGHGLMERMRSTTFAILGITVATGLAFVAIVANQGWSVFPIGPPPSSPPVEAISEATALTPGRVTSVAGASLPGVAAEPGPGRSNPAVTTGAGSALAQSHPLASSPAAGGKHPSAPPPPSPEASPQAPEATPLPASVPPQPASGAGAPPKAAPASPSKGSGKSKGHEPSNGPDHSKGPGVSGNHQHGHQKTPPAAVPSRPPPAENPSKGSDDGGKPPSSSKGEKQGDGHEHAGNGGGHGKDGGI